MIRRRVGNVAGSNVQPADRLALLRAFDSLPAQTRAALRECIPNWNPQEAVRHIAGLLAQGWTLDQADAEMARLVYEADHNNVIRFAVESGCHAHLDAQASIVRYDSASR